MKGWPASGQPADLIARSRKAAGGVKVAVKIAHSIAELDGCGFSEKAE